MMDKVRVHEIAKELGINLKEVVDKAAAMGLNVKTASSTVSMEEAEKIMNYIMGGVAHETNVSKVSIPEPSAVVEASSSKESVVAVETPISSPKEELVVETPAVEEVVPVATAVSKVSLQNFKFHSDLTFDISKKNCLIYGENGTGKSSIYEAFYAVFKTYFRNTKFDFQKFQKSGTSDLSVKIVFDNDHTLFLPSDKYALPEGIVAENKNTIYFANQDLLEFLVGYEDNFYITINQHLKKYFDSLEAFCTTFYEVNRTIDSSNYVAKNDVRQENSDQMNQFLTQVTLRANDIIQNHFQENFELSFQYDWGTSNALDDYKFPTPRITLQIDNKDKLKLNFNEAKLKLASIALFFALIKLAENPENPLKLLVLDDFLTSLDMANRHYIVEYIFNEFNDYQKIILTHNLQFYHLILKLLKSRGESKDWDNKNIFVRNVEEMEESLIYDKTMDYLTQAQSYLKENRLDETGIYLRKEFERIVEELRQINEVGAKEKISKIVDQLLTKKSSPNDVNMQKMQKILTKTKFYQDVLLHSTAHDDQSTEKYTKDLDGAIVILKQLDGCIKNLAN